jgi:hypothetical protein
VIEHPFEVSFKMEGVLWHERLPRSPEFPQHCRWHMDVRMPGGHTLSCNETVHTEFCPHCGEPSRRDDLRELAAKLHKEIHATIAERLATPVPENQDAPDA